MSSRDVIAGLNGLDAGELADVAGHMLERLGAAARTAPAAVDGALLGLLGGTLDRLGSQPLEGAVDDAALAASVEGLQATEARVTGEKLRRIAELDARKAYRGKAMSTADWLAGRLGLSRGEAKAQTEAASALERLPETAGKLRRGELGVGQARQAARGLADLDRLTDAGEDVPADAAARLDDHVATHGPGTTAGALRRSIDEHLHTHTPDALADRERRAHANRRLWVGPAGPDGTAPIEGRLDAIGRASVVAALDALSRPAGPDDDRSYAQRRHDALVTLAQRSLDAGDLPAVAAQRPHIILIGTADGLDGRPGADPCLLDGHGPVSSATARTVACDGHVTEVVLDERGRPLKVVENGKPTLKQRQAVIARDGGCIGCGAPASRCQLHHIRWRRNNGATVVENLVLVCFACHHGVHHDGWTVVEGPTGRYGITRPPEAANGPRGYGEPGMPADPGLRHTA